jgi:superfamily II DNA or RNA helicase
VHKLKNYAATITKRWKLLSSYAHRKYGLTATPVTGHLPDLYSVVSLISPGSLGSYNEFSNKYINWKEKKLRDGRSYFEIESYKNLEELREVLDKVCIFCYRGLDIEYEYLKTTIKDKEEYKVNLEALLEETSNEDGEKHLASKLHRIQMLVNKDKNKLREMLRYLARYKDTGVVLYVTYHETVDLITDIINKFDLEARSITGKTTLSNRVEIKNWFNSNPAGKVVIVNTAGAESLNLHSTNRMLFYDCPSNVGLLVQAIGRINRFFSKFKKIYISFLVVESTIDEYKAAYTEENKDLLDSLFNNSFTPKTQIPSMQKRNIAYIRKLLLWSSKGSDRGYTMFKKVDNG